MLCMLLVANVCDWLLVYIFNDFDDNVFIWLVVTLFGWLLVYSCN